MELKKDIRNDLFKRQEVSFIVENKNNPSFDEMRKQISEQVSKPEDHIDVFGIAGKFGRKTFLVKAFVYDSKKHLDEMVELRKTQKKRKEEEKAEEERKKAEEEAKKKAEEESKAVQ